LLFDNAEICANLCSARSIIRMIAMGFATLGDLACKLLVVTIMHYKQLNETDAENRCAIVLAAGDGIRLRSFVEKLRGDALPKQYLHLIGNQSMLEMAFDRTQKLIPPQRLFTVVSEGHFAYTEVAQQLSAYPQVRVIVQPINKDTGMGLLLPLAHLYERHPDATVVVFPADHFISEVDLFMAHVDAAFGVVEHNPSKIVLLGVAPTDPEPEYGYLVPRNDRRSPFPFGIQEVGCFIEKPQPTVARTLIARGGLWNTMVMVFKAKTLIEHVRRITPQLNRCFMRICDAIGSPALLDVVRQVYVDVEPINLSKGLLEALPTHRASSLLMLPVRGVHWSDWGSEKRILNEIAALENLQPVKESHQSPLPLH
jgi:mannose-1-phosphate guanylyltransferase